MQHYCVFLLYNDKGLQLGKGPTPIVGQGEK